MASIAPPDWKYNDFGAGSFIVRQESPQVMKDEGRCHFIFHLYASEEKMRRKEKAIPGRFLELSVYAQQPEGFRGSQDERSPDGSLRLTRFCPDVARAWGGEVTDSQKTHDGAPWSDNLYGLGYQFFHLLDLAKGFEAY